MAKDYYSILGIPRTANLQDVESGFRRMRARARSDERICIEDLERAYETLRNPNSKRRYDSLLEDGRALQVASPRRERPSVSRAAHRPQSRTSSGPLRARKTQLVMLAGLGVALLAVVAVNQWPQIAWRMIRYEAGTELVYKHDLAYFGQVLAFEKEHRFPEGRVAAAYKLRTVSGEEVWIPKSDVNRLARPSGRRQDS